MAGYKNINAYFKKQSFFCYSPNFWRPENLKCSLSSIQHYLILSVRFSVNTMANWVFPKRSEYQKGSIPSRRNILFFTFELAHDILEQKASCESVQRGHTVLLKSWNVKKSETILKYAGKTPWSLPKHEQYSLFIGAFDGRLRLAAIGIWTLGMWLMVGWSWISEPQSDHQGVEGTLHIHTSPACFTLERASFYHFHL